MRELIRGLVEAIVLVPEDGWLRVEIRGELASILALAEGARRDKGAGDTGALCAQIKMVAGTRFNLSRTRFQASWGDLSRCRSQSNQPAAAAG